MKYAIYVDGKIVFRDGNDIPAGAAWPVGSFLDVNTALIKIINGQLVYKTEDELRIEKLPSKYRTDGGKDQYGNQIWIEKTQEEKDAIDAAEAQAEIDRQNAEAQAEINKQEAEAQAAIQAEIDFENNKSATLKALENIYIDFLTNMWTPVLRNAGIIAEDHTITVDNTDESQNVYMLMQLRSKDWDTYDKMSSEFLRLKEAIVKNGGVMSKVKPHVS